RSCAADCSLVCSGSADGLAAGAASETAEYTAGDSVLAAEPVRTDARSAGTAASVTAATATAGIQRAFEDMEGSSLPRIRLTRVSRSPPVAARATRGER